MNIKKLNKELSKLMNESEYNDVWQQVERFDSNFIKAVKEIAKELDWNINTYALHPNNNLHVAMSGVFSIWPSIIDNYTTVIYILSTRIATEYLSDAGLKPINTEIAIPLSSTEHEIYEKLKAAINDTKLIEFMKTWYAYRNSAAYDRKKREIDSFVYRKGKYDDIEVL